MGAVLLLLLLLQGCCLQHEMLLLGGVHLLQQLGRQTLRSLEGVLDDLSYHIKTAVTRNPVQLLGRAVSRHSIKTGKLS